MAQFAGKYVFERAENVEAHLKGIGVDEERLKAMRENQNKDLEINVNGDEYILKSAWGEKTYTLNKPVDEHLGGNTVKCTATLDGNKLVLTINNEGKTGKRIYELNGNDLTLTLKHDKTTEVAKIFYKKA